MVGRQTTARRGGYQRRVEKNRDKRCKGRKERARQMTVYASLCHSRFMLAARFEEKEKEIKKKKKKKRPQGQTSSQVMLVHTRLGTAVARRRRCGGKTEFGREFRWHRNSFSIFCVTQVCVCMCVRRANTLIPIR